MPHASQASGVECAPCGIENRQKEMNVERYKQSLIDDFKSGNISAVEFTKERFDACFPTRECWAAFQEANGLHIHVNRPEWGDTLTISVNAENPWG
jgi:hypothetical protein